MLNHILSRYPYNLWFRVVANDYHSQIQTIVISSAYRVSPEPLAVTCSRCPMTVDDQPSNPISARGGTWYESWSLQDRIRELRDHDLPRSFPMSIPYCERSFVLWYRIHRKCKRYRTMLRVRILTNKFQKKWLCNCCKIL